MIASLAAGLKPGPTYDCALPYVRRRPARRTRAQKKTPPDRRGCVLLETGVVLMSFALRAARPVRPRGQMAMDVRVVDELHHDCRQASVAPPDVSNYGPMPLGRSRTVSWITGA